MTIQCDVTLVFLRNVLLFDAQAAVNVTLQVIRAVKLVALPKHCQILGDGSGSMTVLSQPKRDNLICMILMAENRAASECRQILLSLFAVPCCSGSASSCFFAVFHLN